MRILITGGAGLVGSHAAEYFARKKCEVVVLDNLMRSQIFGYDKGSVEYNWKFLGQYRNIKRIKGDVRNAQDVNSALGKGVDAVIHTAGQPGVPSSVRIPLEDFAINALGTLNVLECTRKKSPRATIVYCSTNKVYGENIDKIPLKELKTRYVYKDMAGVNEDMLTDLTGHTPYGVSKLTGDLYTQEYAHIYKMKTAVFRMSCIYGARQFGFEDQGWVAWFIIATLKNKPITIYGNGKQVRDLLYVEDLIKGYEAFMNSKLQHGIFNIGGGPKNTTSLLEFIEEIEKLLGKRPKITFSDWRPSDQKVYISDISKIKKTLGWQPKISVKEGIKRLTDWVVKNESYFS
jgi:CDP-paratose 2-epimerase